MTAYAGVRDQEECLSSGMDDCLLKPYTFEQLSEKIGRRRPPQISSNMK
jgi:CheY-like chemotaxis protein